MTQLSGTNNVRTAKRSARIRLPDSMEVLLLILINTSYPKSAFVVSHPASFEPL